MTSKGKSTLIDGEKLKKLRDSKFGTQQRLANKCNVSIKTIQRAEKGESIAPDVANEIAKALNVDTQEILSAADGSEKIVEQAPANYEFLRLKQLTTAKSLFDAAKSQLLEFEFELDLDESTATELAEFIQPIEELNNKNNDPEKTTTVSEQLRVIGKVNDGLKALENKNICGFIGFTTYRETNIEELPSGYDYENYFHSITHKSKAVVQFGNCDSKTAQVLTYIGLTHQEAQEWLEKQHRTGFQNTYVKWGCYDEPNPLREAVLESLKNPTVVQMAPASEDFDDDIIF